ncbi:rod shape-determining protein MreC [Candidatus Nomurabacteria bacterium]|nr:rod shape-determining protein MreC [Candidatus Nomurabacteria bacterium]
MLLLILAVIVLSRGFLMSTVQYVSIPLWKFKNFITNSSSGLFSGFQYKQSLINENEELKKKLSDYDLKFIELNSLKTENDRLNNLLSHNVKTKGIYANVIVKIGIFPFDIFVVDAGLNDGVAVGDFVYVSGSLPIGKIDQVFSNSSYVKLFSSPDEKNIIHIGEKSIQVEAYGVGGGNFYAYVPKDIDVNIGDKIIMPAVGITQFSVVEKVDQKDSDSFKKVYFKNSISPFLINWVEIRKSVLPVK